MQSSHFLRRGSPFWAVAACLLSLCGAAMPSQAQTPFTFRRIARTGFTPIPAGYPNLNAPSGPGVFGSLSAPSLSNGQAAFSGSDAPVDNSRNQAGVYTDIGGVQYKIADLRTAQPNNAYTFNMFDNVPRFSNGVVTFHGAYQTGQVNYEGLYRAPATGGALQVVADFTTLIAPSPTAKFSHLGQSPASSGGNVAFFGGNGNGVGIFLDDAAGLHRITDNGVVYNLHQPALSGQNVAFWGQLFSGYVDIYSNIGDPVGSFHSEADGNTPIPNSGGQTFAGFTDPAISGSNIVFGGAISGGQVGVYTKIGGVFSTVVSPNTAVPGYAGATFFTCGRPSISGQNVAFYASIDKAATYRKGVLFTNLSGSVQPIIGEGDVLDGSTVQTLNAGSVVIDGNLVAFQATLSDGTVGDYVANGVSVPTNFTAYYGTWDNLNQGDYTKALLNLPSLGVYDMRAQPSYCTDPNFHQFMMAAGSPAINLGFDDITVAPNAEVTVPGSFDIGNGYSVSFTSPSGTPLSIVRGGDTYTQASEYSAGSVPAPDTNWLEPTSGENVLSPGGIHLAPGDSPLQRDSLTVRFNKPVQAVGFDLLFQSNDFAAFMYVDVYDEAGTLLYHVPYSYGVPSPSDRGGGTVHGNLFVGFVSPTANISRIEVTDGDNNNVYPDCNFGFDSFRIVPSIGSSVGTIQAPTPVITGGLPADGGIYGPGDGVTFGQVTRTITGTGHAGCTIQLTVSDPKMPNDFNNNRVLTTTVNADGTWSLPLTLDDCDPVIDIIQICPGEANSDPVHRHIYVDGTPPHFLVSGGPGDGRELVGSGGTVDILIDGGASDAGSFVPGDGVSYEWRLYGDGGYTTYTVVSGGGDPSKLVYTAGPGDYYFEVVVTDTAGNKRKKRCHHHVAAPFTILSGLDEGQLEGPGSDPDAGHVAWVVKGTGDPGCTITMSFTDLIHPQNVPAAISTTVSANGTWSLNPDLMDCSYDVVVQEICPDGTQTIKRHVYVDGTAPVFGGNGQIEAVDYAGSSGIATHLFDGTATDETYYPGNGVSYIWYKEGPGGLTLIAGATGATLNVSDPIGDFYYDVVATDSAGNKRTRRCHHQVLVTPPHLTNCNVATDSLWPPNHNLVNVGLGYSVSVGTYPIATTTVIVYSNEGDLGPDGDDNFSPDAKDLTAGALRLRAERAGQSDGRIYLVVITVTDTHGNKDICSHITVTVPHDQSRASRDLIAGKAAAAAAFAEANHGAPPSGYVKVGDGPIIGPKQ